MANILSGYFYDIGGRDIYEDRVRTDAVTTAGGLNLTVAVVADGVGGENRGERAAQLGLDSVFESIAQSASLDVSTVLEDAAAYANSKVHAEQEKTDGASSTLTIAAIQDGKTLYIANVGDSRVYLCRNEKLRQLTIDHTFAQVMVWQGKMTREVAEANPRAEAIMRALGPKAKIPIDVGLYANDDNYAKAQSRGRQGLPLKEGDSILVCSDGLIKDSPAGTPYTKEDEIIRVLRTQEGEKAAKSLVSFAIGRDADDNVSAAVLQMPDPTRAGRARRPMMYRIAAGIVGALLLIGLTVLASNFIGGNADSAAEQTLVAEQAESDARIATLEAQLAAGEIDQDEANAALAAEEAAQAERDLEGTQIAITAQQENTGDAPTVASSSSGAVGASCATADDFGISINDPTYTPERGTEVANDEELEPSVSYSIEVTGDCAIQILNLRTLKGGTNPQSTLLNSDGAVVEQLGVGESGSLMLTFNSASDVYEIDGEWLLNVADRDNRPLELGNAGQSVKLFASSTLEPWLLQADAPATEVDTTEAIEEEQPVVVPPTADTSQSQANQRATADAWNAQATQTAQAQAANARNFQATQTAQAQAAAATARNAQATQTAQAQAANARNFQATQTAQAAAANARNFQATQTAQAQAQAQEAAARNFQATQTAQAQAAAAQPTQPPPPPTSASSCDFSNPTGDADNDQKQNQYEIPEGLNPCDPDTDGDGIMDGLDICPSAFGTGNGCPGDGENNSGGGNEGGGNEGGGDGRGD